MSLPRYQYEEPQDEKGEQRWRRVRNHDNQDRVEWYAVQIEASLANLILCRRLCGEENPVTSLSQTGLKIPPGTNPVAQETPQVHTRTKTRRSHGGAAQAPTPITTCSQVASSAAVQAPTPTPFTNHIAPFFYTPPPSPVLPKAEQTPLGTALVAPMSLPQTTHPQAAAPTTKTPAARTPEQRSTTSEQRSSPPYISEGVVEELAARVLGSQNEMRKAILAKRFFLAGLSGANTLGMICGVGNTMMQSSNVHFSFAGDEDATSEVQI